MKRILYLGDGPTVATGLGVVSKNMLDGIIKNIPNVEITCISINYFGGWHDPKAYPYKIYPAIYNEPADMWGATRLVNVLIDKEPEIKRDFDTLIINSDFFLLDELKVGNKKIIDWLRERISASGIKRTILYTPIDNDYLSNKWIEAMSFFDELIVPSFYAKKVIGYYDKELAKRTKVIYYPLDTANFYPNKNKDKKFTIGYIGRNQWRKDIYRLIEIFDRFKKTHGKAFLHIHTNGTDTMQLGWNLFELMKRKGYYLGQDYEIPIDHNENKGIARESMNDVYNKFDVFVSASTGEGFGLPYAEAMLAGVPVLLPNNTVADEFLGLNDERGYRYACNIPYSFGWTDMNRVRMLGNIDDAVNKLSVIYKNYDDAIIKVQQAREFMQQFTIEKIGKQFASLLLTNKE